METGQCQQRVPGPLAGQGRKAGFALPAASGLTRSSLKVQCQRFAGGSQRLEEALRLPGQGPASGARHARALLGQEEEVSQDNAMPEVKTEVLKTEPYFDLIGFMEMSQESRIDGAVAEELERFWNHWKDLLGVCQVTCGKIPYLVVWLPEEVERTIDETWDKRPSLGFLANALAQYMCMQAVSDLIPQVELSGCAPAPRPTETLRRALAGIGLAYREDMPVLERRFAVVTHYPFRGGCEVCWLQNDCPKGSGGVADPSSTVVLPGWEHTNGER